MKSLLRNLMFVARRYRLSVVLNLLGLTAAFMVFVALLMQIDYDQLQCRTGGCRPYSHALQHSAKRQRF